MCSQERNLVDDPRWEIGLLATVQAFFQRLLSDHIGGPLPTPAELTADAVALSADAQATYRQIHLWIQFLDMAITPAMLRIGLTSELDSEVAEALLRYFARYRNDSASNRDKTDLVATFLFRHPRVPGQWESRGYGLDGSIPLSPFEIALLEILSESDVPVLPEEHVQRLREFNPLLEQARRFRDFPALMDSGIIPRVRELKASLGESIYHPGVLATLAPYNAAFGERFHELFAAAIGEIKAFARQIEELGGSILGTVEGFTVTVDHVAGMNEEYMLRFDYAAALDKFRRIARLKKELQRRPPIRRRQAEAAQIVASPARAVGQGGAAAAPALDTRYVPVAITQQAVSVEEAKLRLVEESIRVFVRVADPKIRQIVPMRYFNLTLSAAEIDAFTADYMEGAGLQAETARTMQRTVAITARMTTEMEELKRAPRMSSIWKMHADCLVVLLGLANRIPEAVAHLSLVRNESPDRQDNHAALHATVDRLKMRASESEKILAA